MNSRITTTGYNANGRVPTSKELAKLNEYMAKAMLLGMVYDPRDHSITHFNANGAYTCHDADSMMERAISYRHYVEKVNRGELGPSWLQILTAEEKDNIWRNKQPNAL